MNAFTTTAASLDVLKPLTKVSGGVAMSASEQVKRAAIKKSAQDFEASFLTSALGSMFAGVTVSAPFGGGEGEQAFKSFLNDAMAKQIVKKGGIGIADAVQREMLKMQGLSAEPVK
ncbi:MAG TPA: rod-binding protein [Caulobacteraceae bacterium]|jgi:Rod binding domain-containing protein|nr:rod-binding protein [Caulobacteraceae bacterium]